MEVSCGQIMTFNIFPNTKMPVQARDGLAAAAADAKRIVRRAGAAYNRHDNACLAGVLGATRDSGFEGHLHGEWGAWRFRWNVHHDGKMELAEVNQAAVRAEGSENDVRMQESPPNEAGAPARADAAAGGAHTAQPGQPIAPATDLSAAENMEADDELSRLRRRAQTQRIAK